MTWKKALLEVIPQRKQLSIQDQSTEKDADGIIEDTENKDDEKPSWYQLAILAY